MCEQFQMHSFWVLLCMCLNRVKEKPNAPNQGIGETWV